MMIFAILLLTAGCVDSNDEDECSILISTEPVGVDSIGNINYLYPFIHQEGYGYDVDDIFFSGNICKETGETFNYSNVDERNYMIEHCPTCEQYYRESFKQTGLSGDNPYKEECENDGWCMSLRLFYVKGVPIFEGDMTPESKALFEEKIEEGYKEYAPYMSFEEYSAIFQEILDQFPNYQFCTNNVVKFALNETDVRGFIDAYIKEKRTEC